VSEPAAAIVTPSCDRASMEKEASSLPVDPADYEYGSDGDPDGDTVARAFAELDRLTLAAERATVARKKAEDAFEAAKDAEKRLLEKDIPRLLESMRLERCVTSSGIEVSVKREIRASLPGHDRVEARQGALRWLVDHGHGGVVKNSIRVDLDRGEDDRADALVAQLRDAGFDPTAIKDVNAQTLGKLVRELFEVGKLVPKELFNLFDQRVAKIARK